MFTIQLQDHFTLAISSRAWCRAFQVADVLTWEQGLAHMQSGPGSSFVYLMYPCNEGSFFPPCLSHPNRSAPFHSYLFVCYCDRKDHSAAAPPLRVQPCFSPRHCVTHSPWSALCNKPGCGRCLHSFFKLLGKVPLVAWPQYQAVTSRAFPRPYSSFWLVKQGHRELPELCHLPPSP